MRQATAKRTPDKPVPDHHVAGVLRSPGKPLDRTTRSFFEPRFGHDFSRVRVHSDEQAARSAEAIEAHAWTSGNHIAFGAKQYEPWEPRGAGLLAHELTHVVQQQNAQPAAALEVGPANDRHESEADAHTTSPTPVDSPRIQRSAWSKFLDVALFIPRLFGLSYFPAEDLKEYLDGMKKRKGPQKSLFSDNMARACIARENEFGPYDTDTKVWLIEDMLQGWTSFRDERSTNALLRRSADRQDIVTRIGRDRLWGNFGGYQRRVVEAITMTAADAGDELVSRLRTLDSDEIQDYIGNAIDPAVRESAQRAAEQSTLLERITAPVPRAAAINAAGEATFTINGVQVTALPDRINPKLGQRAFTWADFGYTPPNEVVITPDNENLSMAGVPPIDVTLRIWSEFATEAAKQEQPGYGVGTRPTDQQTLRFHERGHGAAWFKFLEDNKPPEFTGRAGMRPADYNAAVRAYKTAMEQYRIKAQNYSFKETDCVNTDKMPTAADLAGTRFTVAMCFER